MRAVLLCFPAPRAPKSGRAFAVLKEAESISAVGAQPRISPLEECRQICEPVGRPRHESCFDALINAAQDEHGQYEH